MNSADIAWALLQARKGVEQAHNSLVELSKSDKSYKPLRNKARTLVKLVNEAEESL